MTTTIQCPCGAITLEIVGEPIACFYCHCDDCQAVHGAAYLPAALYRGEQVRLVAGEPLLWKRRTTKRATCGTCGTRIFAETAGGEVRSIVGYLLPKGAFRPTFHVQCRHALLPVRDDLPHYAGFPPEFGGSDERAPW